MNTYPSTDALDREVSFNLQFHRGLGKAIPRWELVKKVFGEDSVNDETMHDDNPSDRQVRKSIERLRRSGQHICNLGNGVGYFVADNRDEYERFKRYYLGASFEKFESVRSMDASADNRWGKVPKHQDPLPLFQTGG